MNIYDDYEHTEEHQLFVESQMPSWQEVSEAIEKADSDHCKRLEMEDNDEELEAEE